MFKIKKSHSADHVGKWEGLAITAQTDADYEFNGDSLS